MAYAMSKQEREAFLAETHVAVISMAESGRGPLTIPVWYSYEPGGVVRFVTGGSSKKAALIRKAGRMSLCVQTETAPYKYVSIEGPVTVGKPNFERDMRRMAYRYLGDQMGEWYLQQSAAQQAAAILVSLTPERWRTVDYGKMI
jgi:hypothetical protein